MELPEERTEWATTTALPDGTARLDVSTAAVRARDESGAWVAIDNDVVREGGVLVVASAVAPMSFFDGAGEEPFARIERDGHVLEFEAPFDLPTPSVDGSQVTYPDVLPGVDLVVTVNEDATGFSEVLRVESEEAASNPRLAELSFPVVTSDEIEVQAQAGGFVAADAAGEAVFISPTPAMWDSTDSSRTVSVDRIHGPRANRPDPTVAPAGDAEVAFMPAEVTDEGVSITPDAELLTDADTVWPVYIDPGVSASMIQRAAIRNAGLGTKYKFTGDEGVGLCSTSAPNNGCSTTFSSRLLWQFNGMDAVGASEPSDVISATFAATGTHSYSCTPQPVSLYAVADFDSSVAFPGGTYWKLLQTKTIAHRLGCGADLEPRRVEFDATEAAKDVARANQGHASLALASNENSMDNWKRYGWDATLSVVYNRAPLAAADVRTTVPDSSCTTGAGRPWIGSRTPTLRAALSDTDGGNVAATFDLVDLKTGARIWGPTTTAAQGSGAEHAVTIPDNILQNEGIYQWGVTATDTVEPPSHRRSGPTTYCEFAVDLADPAVPGVTAVEGSAAVYAEDAVAGGFGQPGLFRLDNGGSADVVRMAYSFGTTELHSSVPASTPMVLFTPKSAGPQTLSVQSVDRAGRTSTVRTYRFTVDFAGRSSGWRLDGVTGGTAVDMAVGNPNPLTVPASAQVVPGMGVEMETDPADRAVRFDDLAGALSSAQPVVPTQRPFSVSATVRLDDTSASATAVSQDGTHVSGFELGHVVDPSCPPGTNGHCWAFSMAVADSPTSASIRALSAVPARPGRWAHITGIRSADGNLRLYVCDIGTRDDEGDFNPVAGTDVRANGSWAALGAFTIGRGRAAGSSASPWRGVVSDARVYTSELSVDELRLACGNPDAMPGLNAPATTSNAIGADFDGNGKADAFWASPTDGLWRVSFNGTSPWTVVNGAPGVSQDEFRFGDLDGDGRDDVFFANPADGRWLVSWGATTAWRELAVGGMPNDQLALADLDGNGSDDVFWANPADGLWYKRNGGRGEWMHINGAPDVRTDRLRFGDVDGKDGEDVFFANPVDGRWMVSYSGSTRWDTVNLAGVPNNQLALGDFEGDGKVDVFWVNPANGLWYVSDDTRGGWRQVNGAPGFGAESYQLADLTGDGKVDVFLGNPGDNRWLMSNGGTERWSSINTDALAGRQVRVR